MTDAIRLTVEVSKRVYQTGHSEENKNPNQDDGDTFSKTSVTQWPPSSDSIKKDNSFPVEQTKSFTVNVSKTELSTKVERWNWVETSSLSPKPKIDPSSNVKMNPPQSVTTIKPTDNKEPVKKSALQKTPAGNAPEQSVNSMLIKPPAEKGGAAGVPPESQKSNSTKVPVKKETKAEKGDPEEIALEKMKSGRKQPRPCKCGKAKDVTLLLKDLCECDTLNLRRINLVKLFKDYQKENKSGNPLPYLTDSLIVYKNRLSRPQRKEKVEWTVIPRKGKKGVQFKKPVEIPMVPIKKPDSAAPVKKPDSKKAQDEVAKIEEEFKKLEKKEKSKAEVAKKDVDTEKKGDKDGKKKVEVTVKYAEESLVTLFKNTSKNESIYNLTVEQLEKLNSD